MIRTKSAHSCRGFRVVFREESLPWCAYLTCYFPNDFDTYLRFTLSSSFPSWVIKPSDRPDWSIVASKFWLWNTSGLVTPHSLHGTYSITRCSCSFSAVEQFGRKETLFVLSASYLQSIYKMVSYPEESKRTCLAVPTSSGEIWHSAVTAVDE